MGGQGNTRPIRVKFAWVRRLRRELLFIFPKKRGREINLLVASLEFCGFFPSFDLSFVSIPLYLSPGQGIWGFKTVGFGV
jgi:hypothetical protein